MAGIKNADDLVADKDNDDPEFRILKGASQRGNDLLLERAGYSYNVLKR